MLFHLYDLSMLLQCQILELNGGKVSHNVVRAFRSEHYRLFQLALHAVFYIVSFFSSVFQ